MLTQRMGDRPIVVVTGCGMVTSLGIGKRDNWARLTAGHSGIARITRFPIDGLHTTIAGTIGFVRVEPLCTPELCERFAEIAIEEALGEAAIGSRGAFPGPLFIGLPPIEWEWPQRRAAAEAAGAGDAQGGMTYDILVRAAYPPRFRALDQRFRQGAIAQGLHRRFGTQGSPVSVTTACASGATAIQLGVEAIRRREADPVLCVGADGSINPETLIRFSLLSALSTQNDPPEAAARPFAEDRDGFVMGEGAGALVLESLDAATARGARILGVIAGVGEKADSFHRTRSSPDGRAIIACIRAALDDAGLEPDQIDYVNAHGTGTPENDKMECLAVSAVLGERARRVPISSNKSMIGHTLSAAGALEAIVTLLTLEHQRLPPTINYRMPDPDIPLDVVPNVARDARVRHAVSNSFGFGGQNVALVMMREPEHR
jgi:3-oxoacyl-[acyl-carrier-protein] synthase II